MNQILSSFAVVIIVIILALVLLESQITVGTAKVAVKTGRK
jgi:hypothetical protein